MKRTIHETYYAINAAIVSYIRDNNVKCDFFKSGIDPATLRKDRANLNEVRYPYIQSSFSNVREQSWTTKESGIFTNFDYRLSYFTAPPSEKVNDSKYFYQFEIIKNAIADVSLNLIGDIATVMSKEGPIQFNALYGISIPSAVMVYKMRAICAYQAVVPDSGVSTDVESGISYVYR